MSITTDENLPTWKVNVDNTILPIPTIDIYVDNYEVLNAYGNPPASTIDYYDGSAPNDHSYTLTGNGGITNKSYTGYSRGTASFNAVVTVYENGNYLGTTKAAPNGK